LDPEGGCFVIALEGADPSLSRQTYLENTCILETELSTPQGDRIRITDFCPRFEKAGKILRPPQLMRKVEPRSGAPRIRVEYRPIAGWSKEQPSLSTSAGLRSEVRGESLWLGSTAPLTWLEGGGFFSFKEAAHFSLSWGLDIEDNLASRFETQLQQTQEYWRLWVKHCSIPSLFQKEVIRSAITLKLHCFEDTGAILAALTTSLPEEWGSTRNWDYRYCWMRDAAFSLSAFHHLGHFEEMEGFLRFLLGIVEKHEASRERLAPVYTLAQSLPLPEILETRWRGHQNSAPVRVHNQAAEHVQNDVYGELILTLAPIFFDERFVHLRTPEHEGLLLRLAGHCERSLGEADAGLWEVRNHWQKHTFSHLLSWAGLDRASRIRPDLEGLKRARELAVQAVRSGVFQGALGNGPADATRDSALALASILRFPDPELNAQTVRQIQKELSLGEESPLSSFYYRYLRKDDFGKPRSAFLICSFWMAQAWARLGDVDRARALVTDTLSAANPLGLFSEHFDPHEKLQLGNFPQAYSHVGLINAAFAVSPHWSEVL
jgi:GH15 family glucan-1,4-alpha-glucosidase